MKGSKIIKEPKPSEWESTFRWGLKLAGVEPTTVGSKVLGYLIVTTILLTVLYVVLWVTSRIKVIVKESFTPKMYTSEQKALSRSRKQFAEYLRSEIIRLNRTENWRDDDFAELEAEVEGATRRTGLRGIFRGKSIFREKSLTRALERSTERFIIVEGDPGAGKSVSLRRVVHQLATKATKSARTDTVLPVYVNLKELKRGFGAAIDHSLIREATLSSISRLNDRFIDEYLEKNFQNDLMNGKLIFLFDSFDEIPEILSSTDSDKIIKAYSDAISDFLGGVNRCRGIIASRAYRGPAAPDWTVFRVTSLSWKRQKDLIYKSMVNDVKAGREVENGILNATDDVRLMARNPMLLGLLCEHVRLKRLFPHTSYEVFSQYLSYRFERDAVRVKSKFGISVEQLRRYASIAAFCMTADTNLGLSPKVYQVIDSAWNLGFQLDKKVYEKALLALSYMRLARTSDPDEFGAVEFTFSHRRFQEYLATNIVLENNSSVPIQKLLTDGRWRETAVVMLQTNMGQNDTAIYEAAFEILTDAIAQSDTKNIKRTKEDIVSFGWAEKELHVLGIVQAGRSYSLSGVPKDLDELITRRLMRASDTENLLDTKLSLDVAGAAPGPALINIMKRALRTRSRWVSDIVYRQAARLPHPEPVVYRAIRQYIANLLSENRIEAEYSATKAFVGRLPEAEAIVKPLQLARIVAIIDRWGFVPIIAFIALIGNGHWPSIITAIMLHTAARYFRPTSLNPVLIAINLRLAAILLTAISLIEYTETSHLQYPTMIVTILAYAIAVYFQLICMSGPFVIQDRSVGVSSIPILPIHAAVVAIRYLTVRDKKLYIYLISFAIALLLPGFVILITKYFGLYEIVARISLAAMLILGTILFAIIGFHVFKEFIRYIEWKNSADRFEPDFFEFSFRNAQAALSHNLMLDQLRIIDSLPGNDHWNRVVVRLIEDYGKSMPYRGLVNIIDEYPDGDQMTKIGNVDRVDSTGELNSSIGDVILLTFNRDQESRRRDLLFICLELVRRL